MFLSSNWTIGSGNKNKKTSIGAVEEQSINIEFNNKKNILEVAMKFNVLFKVVVKCFVSSCFYHL